MLRKTTIIIPDRTAGIDRCLNPFWLKTRFPNIKDRGRIIRNDHFYGKSSVRVFTAGFSESMATSLLPLLPPHLDREYPGLKAVILLKGKDNQKHFESKNGLLIYTLNPQKILKQQDEPGPTPLPNLAGGKHLKSSLESFSGRELPDDLKDHPHLMLQEVGLIPFKPVAARVRSLQDAWIMRNIGLIRKVGRKTFIYTDAEATVKKIISDVGQKVGIVRPQFEKLLSTLDHEERGKLYVALNFLLMIRGWKKAEFVQRLIAQLNKEKVNQLWETLQKRVLHCGIPRDIFLEDIKLMLEEEKITVL